MTHHLKDQKYSLGALHWVSTMSGQSLWLFLNTLSPWFSQTQSTKIFCVSYWLTQISCPKFRPYCKLTPPQNLTPNSSQQKSKFKYIYTLATYFSSQAYSWVTLFLPSTPSQKHQHWIARYKLYLYIPPYIYSLYMMD